MYALRITLLLIAPVPVVVGLLHVFLGLRADALLGAQLPAAVIGDPVLDSQNRFYGAAFMAYGALLFLCTRDLRGTVPIFRIVGAFTFAGGLARLISIALHGVPTMPIIGLLAIELVATPMLLWWHANVLGHATRATR